MANFAQYSKMLISKARKPVLVLVGALVVTLASAWLLQLLGPTNEEAPPKLTVQFQRYMGDYPTELRTWGGKQGMISTYWKVIVSNHGESTDSILDRRLRVGSRNIEGARFYSGLDQGDFDSNLAPIEPPKEIPPGQAISLLIKIGILIPPEVQEQILAQFELGPIQSVEAVHRHLYRAGSDVFGLPVTQVHQGSFEFPKSNDAEFVLLEMETIKNGKIQAVASWYPTVADVL